MSDGEPTVPKPPEGVRPRDRIKDLLASIKRSDDGFTPNREKSQAVFTPPRPEDYLTADEFHKAFFSTKTLNMKKKPRGATVAEVDRPYPSLVPEKPGRKPLTTVEEVVEHKDISAWCTGYAIVDDLRALPPDRTRHEEYDPDDLSHLDLIRHWIAEVSREANPFTLVITEFDSFIPPMREDRERHKWTSKRVTTQHVHERLHSSESPLLIRALADALFGPFPNIARRNQAEMKVRQHVYKLVANGLVAKAPDDPNSALVRWYSTQPPQPQDQTRLYNAPPPEPKTGRYSIRIDGTVVIPSFHEERHEALSHLDRVLRPLGISVQTAWNDPIESDFPVDQKPPRREWPFHVRRHWQDALDVLDDIRRGLFGSPSDPTDITPQLCYYAHWARCLYRPPSSIEGVSRVDLLGKGAPPVTTAEQRYMEQKAHKILRQLEVRGLVVRRKAPDGKRTILFNTNDVEATKYEKVRARV